MKSISQVNLHLSVRYGRYLILALDHERPEDSDYVSIYPMIETENGYALTNELHQDPMFQILYFAFIDGLGVEDRFRTIN